MLQGKDALSEGFGRVVRFHPAFELENDLAFTMQPKSKMDRLILAPVLVSAGLTLMTETDAALHCTPLRRGWLNTNTEKTKSGSDEDSGAHLVARMDGDGRDRAWDNVPGEDESVARTNGARCLDVQILASAQ